MRRYQTAPSTDAPASFLVDPATNFQSSYPLGFTGGACTAEIRTTSFVNVLVTVPLVLLLFSIQISSLTNCTFASAPLCPRKFFLIRCLAFPQPSLLSPGLSHPLLLLPLLSSLPTLLHFHLLPRPLPCSHPLSRRPASVFSISSPSQPTCPRLLPSSLQCPSRLTTALIISPSISASSSLLLELCGLMDTCSALNTGYLLFHLWLKSERPDLVAEFVSFDNANPFGGAISTRAAMATSLPSSNTLPHMWIPPASLSHFLSLLAPRSLSKPSLVSQSVSYFCNALSENADMQAEVYHNLQGPKS